MLRPGSTPPRTTRAAWPLLVLLASLVGGPARASEDGEAARARRVLRGPHPFRHDNALSFAGGIAAAAGGAMGGLRAHLNYGYMLQGSLWLDLQVGVIDGSPRPADMRACPGCGNSADVLAGLAYRLRMNVPVVPYARLAGGIVYLFPAEAAATAGPVVRPAAGAKYFLFDWLGFGIELAGTLGRSGRGGDPTRPTLVGNLELTLGAEWQF